MREILFRGSQMFMKNADWVYGYLKIGDIAGKKTAFILPADFDKCKIKEAPVYWNSVGQYIGLTDNYNTKIFEGDIVRILSCGEVAEVKFNNDDTSFYYENKGYSWSTGCRVEVIGNMYENPSLIDGES